MKQNGFKAICLILMTSIAVLSAFGDNFTPYIESKVLESFNNDGGASNFGGVSYEWRFEASKFATKTSEREFPQLNFVASWPAALERQNPEAKPQNSFGIWGRFDRRGHNWIDIYPVREANPQEDLEAREIPIPGRIQSTDTWIENRNGQDVRLIRGIPIPGRIQGLDMWVWGSNHRYDLEAYFRDYRGMVHIIKLGTINHTGWRNLRATIPASIPQDKIYLPQLSALTFVKFRLWTQPTERVDNFFVYFSQFRILVDTFEMPFDGDALSNPARVQEFWNGGE